MSEAMTFVIGASIPLIVVGVWRIVFLLTEIRDMLKATPLPVYNIPQE